MERLVKNDEHPGVKTGLVFPARDGEFRTSPALMKVLALSGKLAGIPVKLGPKILRKTYITLGALAGFDRLALRSSVGHCDEAMTERYAWVSVDEKRRVTDGLQELVEGPTAPR